MTNFNSCNLNIQSDPLNKTTVTPTNGAPLTSATPNVPLPRPTNQQLGDLYTNCVKLLNENVKTILVLLLHFVFFLLKMKLILNCFSKKKINVKNAFQLKLIDYMSDIVLNKDIGGGTTNFQVIFFQFFAPQLFKYGLSLDPSSIE